MKPLSWIAAGLSLFAAIPCGAQQAQSRNMRFQAMDLDGDGVITRQEWRGNARSFQEHDWNRDGVLSGDEVRPGARYDPQWDQRTAGTSGRDDAANERSAARFRTLDTNNDGRVTHDEWRGSAAVFSALDANRDGVLTRSEAVGGDQTAPDDFRRLDANGDGWLSRNEWHWNRAAFDRLDADRDGRLSADEFDSANDPAAAAQHNGTWRKGYDRGRIEGTQAGKEDKPRHWDLEGQRELEAADSGYENSMGSRADYQAGYRAGFRQGYREGFGPR
jgi:Ca2+-binding EF-hand superfamily protein